MSSTRRVVLLPNPGASGMAFPNTATAMIISLSALIVTNATVGSRAYSLSWVDATGVVKIVVPTIAIPASTTGRLTFAVGVSSVALGAVAMVALPVGMIVEVGDFLILTDDAGVSAGDRITDVVAVVDLL